MRVEWAVFRDKPGLQLPAERVPGDEITCWRAAEPNCFEVPHYGPSQLHVAERDFIGRIEKNQGSDQRATLLLGRLLRNHSVDASVRALLLDPQRVTPYLTLAHVLPVGGSPALYGRALQLAPAQTCTSFTGRAAPAALLPPGRRGRAAALERSARATWRLPRCRRPH